MEIRFRVWDLRLTGKHLGDSWRDIDVSQTFITTGMEESQYRAVVQWDPNAQTTGICHTGNSATCVTAYSKRMLDIQSTGI